MFPKQMSGTSISAWCAVAQWGEQSYNRVVSSSLARILPKNCNLRKSFSPINSCVDGIQSGSSPGHAIGCMLRQHPFHYAFAALCATGERHLRRTVWADL